MAKLHSKFQFTVEGQQPKAKPKTTAKQKAAKTEGTKGAA